MNIVFIKILQLIVSLSIIVTVHELGHFLGAIICKTRVDKFYLFFNPWFSLFKKKVKHTEYGIGWIPVGGYVKIAGMMDESMDKEALKNDPAPWEYRSKKPWQKLIMITGGVIFNFFLAWAIYACMLVAWGDAYIDARKIPYGIAVDSAMEKLGFRDGDYILAIDGKATNDFSSLTLKMLTSNPRSVSIKRGEQTMDISIPNGFSAEMINQKNTAFIGVRRARQAIDSVVPSSAAERIGLRKGDEIIFVDKDSISFLHELGKRLKAHKNEPIVLGVKRGNSLFYTSPFSLPEGVLGIASFAGATIDARYGLVKNSYNLFTAIPRAFVKNVTALSSYLSQLKLLIGGKVNVNENIGGLISIGKIFPSEWNWERFWGLTAFLSLIIGIFNIFPIPALDGGHAVIILIEWAIGRPLPRRAQEITQTVGFVLVVGLMIYGLGLDIFRLFKN